MTACSNTASIVVVLVAGTVALLVHCVSGMTDLLSPLLYSLNDDVEAFYCFTVFIERTAFFKPAKDRVSLRRQMVSTFN